MSLPIIESPTFTTTLPTGKELKFRPFNVKEQKNLLIISEGGTDKEIFSGIIELVDKCTFGKFDWLKEPTVNLEHAFLHIRAKSVGEVVELTYECLANGCGHKNHMSVDVRDAKPTAFPMQTIKIDETVSLFLEQMDSQDVLDLFDGIKDSDLLKNKVKMVVYGDEVITEFTNEEFSEFAESFPVAVNEKIEQFLKAQPTLVLDPPTKCAKCGTESHLEIRGVLNFFG